ncbi:hypothetical protein BaRGS_00040483 [Batillaria attramentaria]|uniref:LITAF domain-containing protein n=1 Tax=Batillaria attramentaria TaxID=370345 RepID=A0ABD0IZX7_9CAEN
MSKVGQEPPPPPPEYNAGGSMGPPPPYGGPGTTTVVMAPPAAVPGHVPQYACNIKFRESPALVVCQHCHATVTTSTHYTVGLMTWAACGGIVFFGFWMGCCLIPFCINGCKDVIHTCPNCNREVGRHNRLEF